MTNAISSSMEDYLEVIYHVIERQAVARPKDISQQLKVTAPSVTKALHWLADHKLVNYEPFGLITLTEDGLTTAKDVVRRHESLRDFFVRVLSIDEELADEAACKMEHSVSADILERLIQYAEFVEVCPRGGSKWIKGFGYRCSKGETIEDCELCVSECLEDIRHKKQNEAEHKKRQVSLKDMQAGERGRIVRHKRKGPFNRRLIEMGVGVGTVVEVERVAPLGDPIEIKIRGYHLSLRKEDAASIQVTLLQPSEKKAS